MEAFPTFAFCFGFKPDVKDEDILNIRNIKNWKEGQSIQTMNSTFRKSTFDFLLKAKITEDYEELEELEGPTKSNFIVETVEVYSEFGRCYSYYSNEKISINMSWRFLIKDTM